MTYQEYYEKVFKEYADASIEFLKTETEEAKQKFQMASKIYFDYLAMLSKESIDLDSEYVF